MGRLLPALCSALLAWSGCVALAPSVTDPCREHWEQVCTRLRAPRRAAPSALPAGADHALSRVADQAEPALVRICTTVITGAQQAAAPDGAVPVAIASGGSGVVIDPDGVIATSAHVVRGAVDVRVLLADGRSCAARAVAVDPHLDLAVLRIDAHALRALNIAAQPAAAGTPVVAMAAVTRAGSGARRSGVVLAPAVSLQAALDPVRPSDYHALIETTTELEPGFSGGPLLDADGRLIGLNVATRGSADGHLRGYALPLDEATCAAIAQLVAATRAPQPDRDGCALQRSAAPTGDQESVEKRDRHLAGAHWCHGRRVRLGASPVFQRTARVHAR